MWYRSFFVLAAISFACGGDDGGSPANPDASTPGSDAAPTIDAASGDPDAAPIPLETAAYFVGDYNTNNVPQLGRATFPGPAVETLTLPGLDADPQFLYAGASADGTVVVAATQSGGSVLIRAFDADLGNPRTLVDDTSGNAAITDLEVSPDGALVAFAAILDGDDAHRLYVVPTDASGAAAALSPDTNDNALRVDRLMWSHDSAHVLYRGDLEGNNLYGAWVVDATATSPSPVELTASVTLSTGQGVNDLVGFDSVGKVYFQSDHDSDGSDRLYRADLDGGNFEEVPFTAALSNGDGQARIGKSAFNRNGSRLAFSADSPTADLLQVFVVDIGASTPTPTVVSAVIDSTAQVRGPERNNPMVWSPDDSMLAVGSDWEDGESDTAVFVLPTSGTPGGTKLVAPVSGGDAEDLAFALDSASLFVVGTLDDTSDRKLYHLSDLSTAEQMASSVILQDVPTNGDISNNTLRVVGAP